MIFPQYIETALDILEKNGFEGYVVGGAVRDFVMGNTPHDYDITTSALPEETKECFKDFKTIDTGIKHGTVAVLIDGNLIEITTYRIDGDYKDGRHPESVSFSRSLDEDLKRRDFTVNAMAFGKNNGLYDIFGGREDVLNKVIRCVGEPDTRFNEDALRMLRALRFSSVLGFEIHKDTKESIKKNIGLLKSVSEERIFEELKKLIVGSNSENVFREFNEELKFITKSDCAENFRRVSFYSSLALIYETPESALSALKSLKADNKTVKFVTKLVEYKNYPVDRISLKKLIFCEGEEFAEEFGIFKNESDRINEIFRSGECVSLKQLEIKGNHLKEMGFKGEEIKNVLSFLLDKVLENNDLNKYEVLKALTKEFQES